MSFDEHDFKVLENFLKDCAKVPSREIEGKKESDRKYMIKLLDHLYWDIKPRAEELLKLFEPLREVRFYCNQCRTFVETKTNKEIIKCPACDFQNLVYKPKLDLLKPLNHKEEMTYE